MNQHELNVELCRVSAQGDLNAIMHLMTSPELKIHAIPSWGAALCQASKSGKLEIVQYFLHDDGWLKAQAPSTRQAALNAMLVEAAQAGHVHIMSYLMTSPRLQVKPEIHNRNEHALKAACCRGHLEVVQYLLSSQELSEHANLPSVSHYCVTSAHANNQMHVVNYLLYEANAALDTQDPEVAPDLIHLVQKRDLFVALDEQTDATPSSPKAKI